MTVHTMVQSVCHGRCKFVYQSYQIVRWLIIVAGCGQYLDVEWLNKSSDVSFFGITSKCERDIQPHSAYSSVMLRVLLQFTEPYSPLYQFCTEKFVYTLRVALILGTTSDIFPYLYVL